MAMNLGEEQLRAVNTSRPALVHTSSQHSIAASDDYYYSFSDQSSHASSDEATTVIRHRSPEETRQLNPPRLQQHDNTSFHSADPPTEIAALPETPRRFPLSRNNSQHPPATHPEEEPISPTAVTVRHISSVHAGDETPRPATMVEVSNDSTPVARQVSQFEPLQGQESILGAPDPQSTGKASGASRHPSSIVPAVLSENSNVAADNRYSLQRSGAPPSPPPRSSQRDWKNPVAQPVPTPGVDSTPELHFALDQLTRDEEIRGSGRYSRDSWGVSYISRPETRESIQGPASADPRVSKGSDTRPLVPEANRKSLTPPRKPVPVSATPEALLTPTVAAATEPSPNSRVQANRESTQSWLSAASDADANFKKDAKYNSVPGALSVWGLLPLIILCAFVVAALVVSSVHSAYSHGLNRYDGTGTSLYFVYRYLPQLFAAVILVWLQVVQAAVQRILPFVLIRSRQHKKTRGEVLRTTPLFVSNYLLPNLGPFQDGEIGLGLCNLIFWLAFFNVPLASAVYTPTYFSDDSSGYWRWSAVQAVCWTLIAIFFLLIIALIFVLFRFNLRPTGLRWDPRSIADILVLLRRLNNTIKRRSSGPRPGRFDYRPASLGLWRSSSDPNIIAHGIGVPQDLEAGRGTVSEPQSYRNTLVQNPQSLDDAEHHSPHHQSTFESWQSGRPDIYAWLPWFLRPSPVALWIAIAVVLLIAFLVVSWVNRAIEVGFDPQLSVGPNAKLNFSSANFLWAFLPALLGMFLYIFWLPFDAYYRALQPYVDMQTGPGASAAKSVLLEYPAQAPFFVSIRALLNGHYRVAWVSFVPLIAISIPVLAGGVFQAQYIVGSQDTIREIASTPGFIALCVLVAIYALSFLVLWPSRKHRLPDNIRYVSTLGDFVVGGRMLNESAWKGSQTKSDLVGRLMTTGFTSEKAMGQDLFIFGDYTDMDGRERIGIHRD